MNQFDKFKAVFDEQFDNIEQFIDAFDNGNNSLNGELKLNETEDISDSYDYTDENLKRVFYFPEFNIYVKFTGRNQSYDGTTWSGMEEVKEVTKTISVYE